MTVKSKKQRQAERDQVREMAEADLYTFARLINPQYMYGDIHREVFYKLQHTENPNLLLLLPRGHLKSHCMAVWVAWWITKYPHTTVIYISATIRLAEKQLYAIKNMLTNDNYRRYWPEMVNPEEAKREKWSATEICVDHPKRKAEGIRDSTITASGLTTNIIGLHSEVVVADDVVTKKNSETIGQREKTASIMSLIVSILDPSGKVRACGTRYHPSDQYDIWKKQFQYVYNEDDEVIGTEPLWEVIERVVETEGVFLWPRAFRTDGAAYGFDRKELARIEAMYTDRMQFYAQYYNNPNDVESNRLTPDKFQYYDPKFLHYYKGVWSINNHQLSVYAAMDFAYSMGKRSDYTAIVIIGIDSRGYIYLLDIDRFKTDRYSDYCEHAKELYKKWMYKKIRVEIKGAQKPIVNYMRDEFRTSGYIVKFDEYSPTSHTGSKEERMSSTLEPLYDNQTIWHYRGGYIPMLEEELILARPPHDDIKDALTMAVQIAVKPAQKRAQSGSSNVVKFNKRFGGRSF